MVDILAKSKTLLTSFVTYAVLSSTVLTIVSEELPSAAGVIAKAVAFLATAVTIVRRVTPVIESQRGLTPVAYPEPAPK